MRVAALYDIHGNLPALEAVLDDVRRDPAGLIVFGGGCGRRSHAGRGAFTVDGAGRPGAFCHG